MVSASIVKWLGIGLIAALALLGTLFFIARSRGWMRNGYFTIITTLLIVGGIFIVFQAVGGMLALAVGGLDLKGDNIGVLGANGLAQLAIMLVGIVVISRGAGQNPFAVFRLQGFG